MISKIILLSGCLYLLIQLAGLPSNAIAQSSFRTILDPKRVSWSKLSYRVKNFSAKVDTEVNLESLPTADVEAALIKSSEGVPIMVSVPKSYKISVNRVVDSIFSS